MRAARARDTYQDALSSILAAASAKRKPCQVLSLEALVADGIISRDETRQTRTLTPHQRQRVLQARQASGVVKAANYTVHVGVGRAHMQSPARVDGVPTVTTSARIFHARAGRSFTEHDFAENSQEQARLLQRGLGGAASIGRAVAAAVRRG